MEDLQSLLEKINREGVEKAQAEAERILAEARARADEIVKTARAEAENAATAAERRAKEYAAHAEETLRQAVRDTVRAIETAVTNKLQALLTENVERSLADDETALALVSSAIRELTGDAEISTNAKLAALLKAQFANQKNITVITDETQNTGFSVRLDGGRVEHTFTADVISAELAKRLRPDLAALLK